MSSLNRLFFSIIISCISLLACAGSDVVKSIKVVGNQRLPDSSIEAYCPIKKGDVASNQDITNAITSLYESKQFSAINIELKNNVLVIDVVERPTIKSIKIKKNKLIPDEAIDGILQKANLIEGQVYNPAPLQEIKYSLAQQYKLQGYPNVQIDETITEVSGNQVKITLTVKKEKQFQVSMVSVLGNQAFTKATIVEKMGLNTPSWYAWIMGGNYYSDVALEKGFHDLKIFYDSKGFLEFKVASYEVKPSGKGRVDLSMVLDEGPLYTISSIKVEGDAAVEHKDFPQVDNINTKAQKEDYPFSRAKVDAVRRGIRDTLEKEGYPLANIEPKFQLNESEHKVEVTYQVEKGRPIMVRFVEFEGNSYTLDKVLRREMALSEGELFTQSALEESKRRIANLPYLKDVRYTVVKVPGNPSQVDIIVSVEETPSATANFDLGYNQTEGVVASAGLNHPNFLGTGNTINVKLERASGRSTAALNGYVPFVFNNGLGVGYNIQYDHQEKRTKDTNSRADYTTQQAYSFDSVGAGMNVTIPVTVFQTLNLGGDISNITYFDYDNAPPSMYNYIETYGDNQWKTKLRATWQYNSLDKALMPTRGGVYMANLNIGLPFGDNFISYYTLHTRASWFKKIGETGFTFNPRAHVAVGGGFKKFEDFFCVYENPGPSASNSCDAYDLPPPEKFYGGATEPVRGIMNFGDKFMGEAIGGDLLTTVSMNMYLPQVLGDMVQSSAFIDGGYIYNQKDFDFSKWEYSTGLQFRVQTPMAPVTLLFSWPLNIDGTDDGTTFKRFQFSFQTSLY